MKKCFVCSEEKDLSEFYSHRMMADGHLNKCKECCKNYAIKRRADCDETRLSDIKRYRINPKRKNDIRKQAINWRIKYPEKYKAQTALNNAIRDKKLTRMACGVCGNEKSHAHHHDYSKPLDVMWLCARCHALQHKNEKI